MEQKDLKAIIEQVLAEMNISGDTGRGRGSRSGSSVRLCSPAVEDGLHPRRHRS